MILAILIFCNLVIAFTTSLAAKPHKQVIVENTFPADKLNDPEVILFRKNYQKRQFQLAGILSVLDLVLLFPMKESIFMLLFFVLLYFSIGASYLVQLRYIRKGHQLLVKNQWQLAEQPIRVDTKLIVEKNRKLVPIWWFAPALACLFLFTFVLQAGSLHSLAWFLLLLGLLVLLLFIMIWRSISHLPVRALTNDSLVNQRYNDLTKFYWSTYMILSSLAIVLIIYLPLLTMTAAAKFFVFLTIIEFLLILLFCGLTLWWLLRLRKKQDQVLAQTTTFRYTGDDYYWRYGMYLNPDDSRLMIPDRIGMNLSINLGKTIGKIFLVLLPILLIGAMLVTVIPLYTLDYHPDPLTYKMTHNQLILDGPLTHKQKIDYDQIENVQLIDQMPQNIIKVNGLATDDYALGNFKLEGKSTTLFVEYQSKPILKITTKDRDFYYTNKEAAKTKSLFKHLQAQ
ncbi:hypothetical protein RV04_GL001697 [Enterococcus hermanniensis]|uniref:Bacterial Pleckstrin homology domain-containing protein n=2 Tax=Enterococcus hermanniensis TaxID=249189 RepID=A0A1L8TNN0_9ENTE|nr:hypothetical protein RV04_GL001697 [Enterococcus hermanniensis]